MSDMPKKLIFKLSEVMGSLPWLEKRGQNQAQRYAYATEADALDMVREKLAAKRIFVLTSIDAATRSDTGKKTSSGTPVSVAEIRTKHTFMDGETGESLEVFGAGWAEDSGDKAIYKAITGAMKYFLMKNFMIPTGDDPEEDEEPKVKPEKTAAQQLGPFSHGKSFEEHKKETAAPGPSQRDLGSFKTMILGGQIKKESEPGAAKPWTCYELETSVNGTLVTFSKVVFDMCKQAKAENCPIILHCEPNPKGPQIKDAEWPAGDPRA